MKNERDRRRIRILLATGAVVVLALFVVAWNLASGQWLWVIVNGFMQGELR